MYAMEGLHDARDIGRLEAPAVDRYFPLPNLMGVPRLGEEIDAVRWCAPSDGIDKSPTLALEIRKCSVHPVEVELVACRKFCCAEFRAEVGHKGTRCTERCTNGRDDHARSTEAFCNACRIESGSAT